MLFHDMVQSAEKEGKNTTTKNTVESEYNSRIEDSVQ